MAHFVELVNHVTYSHVFIAVINMFGYSSHSRDSQLCDLFTCNCCYSGHWWHVAHSVIDLVSHMTYSPVIVAVRATGGHVAHSIIELVSHVTYSPVFAALGATGGGVVHSVIELVSHVTYSPVFVAVGATNGGVAHSAIELVRHVTYSPVIVAIQPLVGMWRTV